MSETSEDHDENRDPEDRDAARNRSPGGNLRRIEAKHCGNATIADREDVPSNSDRGKQPGSDECAADDETQTKTKPDNQ